LLRTPTAIAGFGIICLLALAATIGPRLFGADAGEFNPDVRLKPPVIRHPFGTDTEGRDIFARVVLGSRISLAAAGTIIVLAATVGSTAGLVAGFAGGRVELAIMRLSDVFLAVPPLILAIAVAMILGPSLYTSMVGLATAWWPVYARLMRAETKIVSRMLYVEAAVSLGASRSRILYRHLLPNSAGPVMVQASLDFGQAVLYSSALSFIGLGAQPPSPEWGAMISAGRDYLQEAWWFTTFPGAAIFVSVLGFNLVGDTLRDLIDPRWRRTGRERDQPRPRPSASNSRCR
jgi:peptide/nickel transport system permease protein